MLKLLFKRSTETPDTQPMSEEQNTLLEALKASERDLRAAQAKNNLNDHFYRTIFRYGSQIRPVVASKEQLDYISDAPGFHVGEDGTVAYGTQHGSFLFGTPQMIRSMNLSKAIN